MASHRVQPSSLGGGLSRGPIRSLRGALFPLLLLAVPMALDGQTTNDQRPRARDLGLDIGIFPPGPMNAITDVPGVRVGQITLHHDTPEGGDVRTGITVVHPHGGNAYLERVPAAIHVGNGFGKLVGVTQVRELGEIESPLLLTCTLCVWRAADALAEWLLEQPGMAQVRSINPVVGETNDGGLNDIRARPVTAEHVRRALETASTGPVEEGSVGAGTGTRAFGWKGGIGTTSRILPESLGGWRVGVLVQSNFGGILTMGGAPVGRALGRYSFQREVEGGGGGGSGSESAGRAGMDRSEGVATGGFAGGSDEGDGSIMIVIATDAPLLSRNLERLAARAMMGLARTGSFAGNGSGDYVIAFSTDPSLRRAPDGTTAGGIELPNNAMSPLFQAVVEAVEEAVYNSILRATTVSGMGTTAEAIPIPETVEVLRRHGAVPR